MKILIPFLFLPLAMFGQGVDKYLHFGAGYVASSASSAFSYHVRINRAVTVGFGVGAVAGLGKEVRDQIVYKGFDPVDLLFTAQGSLFGSLCVKAAIVPRAEYKNKKEPIKF